MHRVLVHQSNNGQRLGLGLRTNRAQRLMLQWGPNPHLPTPQPQGLGSRIRPRHPGGKKRGHHIDAFYGLGLRSDKGGGIIVGLEMITASC